MQTKGEPRSVLIVNLLCVSWANVFNEKCFGDGGDEIISISPINNPF